MFNSHITNTGAAMQDRVIFETGSDPEFPSRAVYYRNGIIHVIAETSSQLRSFGWTVIDTLLNDLFKQDPNKSPRFKVGPVTQLLDGLAEQCNIAAGDAQAAAEEERQTKAKLIAAGWTEEALQEDAKLLEAAARRDEKQAEADAADEFASLPPEVRRAKEVGERPDEEGERLPHERTSNLFAIYRDGNPHVWILEVYGEAKANELCRTLNNNFHVDAFFTQRVN